MDTIKVIEFNKKIVDVVTASQEELEVLYATLEEALSQSDLFRKFQPIIRTLQGPLSVFLNYNDIKKFDTTFDSIAMRELIASKYVIPIISTIVKSDSVAVNTRSSYPKTVIIDEKTSQGVAEEEPFYMIGYKIGNGSKFVPYPNKTIMFTSSNKADPIGLLCCRLQANYEFGGIDIMQSNSAAAATLSNSAAAATLSKSAAALFNSAPQKILSNIGDQIKSTTWRDNDLTKIIKYFLSKLMLNADYTFDMTPLQDLYNIGALNMLFYVYTEGKDSLILENLINERLVLNEKLKKIKQLEAEENNEMIKVRMVLAIINDKFGAQRYNEILDKIRQTTIGVRSHGAPGGSVSSLAENIRINNSQSIFAVITPREKEVVENEFKLILAKTTTVNNCPHVKAVYKYRHASDVKSARLFFDELKKYFKNENEKNDWIICKNCDNRMLCPHVTQKDIKNYIIHIDRGDKYSYFCKICSEKIGEYSEENRSAELLGKYGNYNTGLKTKIWSIAMGAFENLNFMIPTNDRAFASIAADKLYPLVLMAEENLDKKVKRKRNDEDEVNPRTHVFAILFVYAYILDLIQVNLPNINFTGVKSGSKASVYAEQILKLIIKKYNSVFYQLNDITNEYLKDRFSEAYTIIHSGQTSIPPANNQETNIIYQITKLDPLYRYAVSAAKISGALPIERPTTPADAKKEFETIMGCNITEIIKESRDKDILRNGWQIPIGKNINMFLKEKKANLFSTLYEFKQLPDTTLFDKLTYPPKLQHWIGAAQSPHRATQSPRRATGNFKRPLNPLSELENIEYFESYRLISHYSKNVNTIELLDVYQEELNAFNQKEKGLRIKRAYNLVWPVYDFGYNSGQQYENEEVQISSIYDENGIAHKWSVYIYLSDDKEMLISGYDGIKRAINSGKINLQTKLIDVQCSICNIRKTKTNKLNSDKIWKSIRQLTEYNSFFTFYESRCPIGDLHNWDSETKTCTKCSMTTDNTVNKKTDSARQYFEKYIDNYHTAISKTRSPVVAISNTQLPDAATTIHVTKFIVDFTPDKWEYDYNAIFETSKMLDVEANVIEAIGNMDGREYADIIEGIKIPPPPTSSSDPRIYTTDAEVRYFLSEYNKLRFIFKNQKIPIKTIELLNDAKVPEHEYSQIEKLLPPDISDNYNQKFELMKHARPSDVQKFSIMCLCNMVRKKMPPSEPQWVSYLLSAFVKQEMTFILRNQKLFSKHGVFNWGIFEAKDYEVDVSDDEEDEELDVEEENDENAQFTGANMDYDMSENNPNNEIKDD
jgi:hypothetical protein